jgi:hypothetical protein
MADTSGWFGASRITNVEIPVDGNARKPKRCCGFFRIHPISRIACPAPAGACCRWRPVKTPMFFWFSVSSFWAAGIYRSYFTASTVMVVVTAQAGSNGLPNKNRRVGRLMQCPPEIANIVAEIITTGVLRIRALGLNSGGAERCAVEADHIHNLPRLLSHFKPELLDYYWHAERLAFIRQSTAEKVEGFEPLWNALAPHVDACKVPS